MEGRYLYCILKGTAKRSFGNIGLLNSEVHTIDHGELSAVVSAVPIDKIEANLENVTAHERVVEASREVETTLPVRFGTIFKTERGVKQLMEESYRSFRTKIDKLGGKDEFGVKAVLDNESKRKLRRAAEEDSEVVRTKKQASRSGEGTSYFLKMHMDDMIKSEMLRRIERIGEGINDQLAKFAADSVSLRIDHDQIILNKAYLVERDEQTSFSTKLEELREKYKGNGVLFHISGPWAPYSFC